MKPKAKALIAASVLAISLMLSLLVFPSPGTPTGVKLVMASNSFGETRINSVKIRDNSSPTQLLATFTASAQTATLEIGQVVGQIWVYVYIDDSYVIPPEPFDATRVYLTIKNPANSVVYENYGYFEDQTQRTGYWEVIYSYGFGPDWITLTEGTWTVITKYEIYA